MVGALGNINITLKTLPCSSATIGRELLGTRCAKHEVRALDHHSRGASPVHKKRMNPMTTEAVGRSSPVRPGGWGEFQDDDDDDNDDEDNEDDDFRVFSH